MDHYYDTHTGRVLWDFDNLPGAGEERQSWYGSPESIHAVRHTSEELYTPLRRPGPACRAGSTGEKRCRSVGQTVSLLRSAQWRRWGELELYAYFRVETWRFWERSVLDRNWFTAVDDLGNVYDLSGEGSGVQSCIGETDCGPLFRRLAALSDRTWTRRQSGCGWTTGRWSRCSP